MPEPNLTLDLSASANNLSSNNPFRNRAASPHALSPGISTPNSGNRPVSRNPFLATFEDEPAQQPNPNSSFLIDMSATVKESPKKATFGTSAEELFSNMSLNDASGKKGLGQRPAPPRPAPHRSGTLPLAGHRPSRSGEEEKLRGASRGPSRPRGPPAPRNGQGSPERANNRRPRRNSDSSIIDKRPLDADEERKRRERRKEREARGKDGKSRSHRQPKKPHGLDLIDKLDVSGIYGPSLFHHDGPFDACNPHRNRKKDHRAPMEAFPVNSANNAIGGSGPVNKNIDLEKFHGRGAEGFTDFSRSGNAETEQYKKRPSLEGRTASFNPKGSVEPVHGEETYGLGTSTFLEGAPASRTAIQQRQLDDAAAAQNGGIGRKKSIAQRIRGISQPRRTGFGDGAPGAPRITSPESRYDFRPGGSNALRTPGSPPEVPPKGPQSAGGYTKVNESNPFFDDYDEAYDKKGATIKVAESGGNDASKPSGWSPTSPSRGNGLTRQMTADSSDGMGDSNKPTNGFLSRVKSLKGGRRTRPERRPS
ncbi:Pal1-domain-containing protein [Lophium mytilinum]|uniref:Pal1-domain-containing protein n=1 Tax=Lophium mytilinum TaxID=390894 RepID=A0A6A6RFH1_9PEZI|nr:Pal1-domain-containing protein [Lophium mytilinum]